LGPIAPDTGVSLGPGGAATGRWRAEGTHGISDHNLLTRGPSAGTIVKGEPAPHPSGGHDAHAEAAIPPLDGHGVDRRRRAGEACIRAAAQIHAEAKKHRKYGLAANLTADNYERDARLNERRAVYEAALKEKYLHAARYPWLPVEPNPPVPKLEPEPR
jgi:hypothetical protein